MAAGNILVKPMDPQTRGFRVCVLRRIWGREPNSMEGPRVQRPVWGALLLYWRRRKIVGLPRGR